MMMMACCGDACREYTAGYGIAGLVEITMDAAEFGLRQDVTLYAERSASGKWNLKLCPDCVFVQGNARASDILPRSTEEFQIRTPEGTLIYVLWMEEEPVLSAMEKYLLRPGIDVTIGSEPDNVICYTCRNYISRYHARLIQRGHGWFLQSSGKNGIFVNGKRVHDTTQLHFGDEIYLFGLKLVYFGTVLAVGNRFGKRVNDSGYLRPYDVQKNELGFVGRYVESPYFSRSPRYMPTIVASEVSIEMPPNPQNMKKRPLLSVIGPSLTMALPMMLGCMLMMLSMGGRTSFLFLGVVTSLSSALLGAVWAIMNIRNQENDEQEKESKRFHSYGNYLISIARELSEKYDGNYRALHSIYPSTEVCTGYGRTTPELWCRNFSHEDLLFARLGLGDVPFQIKINVPKRGFYMNADRLMEYPEIIRSEFSVLHSVPVGLDLRQNRLIGLVGRNNRHLAAELAKLILCQLAANCCYTDVKFVLINGTGGTAAEREWGFLRRLPHSWSENRKVRYCSMSPAEAEDVSHELIDILRRRVEQENGAAARPHYVVVITDPDLLENGMLSSYVLNPHPQLGLSTLVLSDSTARLPNVCTYVVESDGTTCVVSSMMDVHRENQRIVLDRLRPGAAEHLAQTLADIRVEEKELNADIPSLLTFLEMYGARSIADLHIPARWRHSRTDDSMRVPIGMCGGGKLCFLDIHEKYHGPHGLVAGMTGSGKSETLQTFILSLCINFSPEDINFFLIDYKGGGMANLFHRLPHLVGQITNLSGNQIRRAMISIKSENIRRQRLFNQYGVNNINQYTRMYKEGEGLTPLPHLLIIIDEFAELKTSEPDFMQELISVSQVGRSLGIHLILACQKPSGTVNDNIRANSKFRLCLQVQEPEDSMGMIKRPDAAFITQKGGAILQVGNDELLERFQSAWSGAVYDESQMDGSAAVILGSTGKPDLTGNRLMLKQNEKKRLQWYTGLVRLIRPGLCADGQTAETMYTEAERRIRASGIDQKLEGLDNLLRLWPEHPQSLTDEQIAAEILKSAGSVFKLPEQTEQTQLEAVVGAVAELSAGGHYRQAWQLWLPVLPEKLCLDTLEGWSEQRWESGSWNRPDQPLETVIGLLDDPENQAQVPLRLDLMHGGHHAILGTVSSGKSTFLQTALYGLFHSCSPSRLQAYLIDFSSRLLSVFESLPHVGGIVYENEPERLEKLFYLIFDILEERKEQLKGGSWSEFVRLHPDELPAILLVVDNYAGLKEKTDGKYEQQMMQLSREGLGYGIFLILSAAGFGMNEISGRMAENMRTTVCLEMADKYKYVEALRVARIAIVPESGIHGRGLVRVGDRCLEYQTAVINDAPDEYTRGQRAQEEFLRMAHSWSGMTARRIPEIPKNPALSQLAALPEYRRDAAAPDRIPVGYDRETAAVYSIPLHGRWCSMIAGAARSGKSNALRLILAGCMHKQGAQIMVFCEENSMMYRAAQEYDVRTVSSDAQLYAFLKELTPEFVRRNKQKQAWLEAGVTDEELFERMQQYPPVFLLIDDLSLFFRMIYKPAEGVGQMSPFMENILAKGACHNIYLFGCVSLTDLPRLAVYAGYKSFSEEKQGLLLGIPPANQRVFEFGPVSYQEAGKQLPRGTAAATVETDGIPGIRYLVLPLAGR